MSEEKDNKWEMPKPVFKKSEGSLPRSLEETISTSFMANAETIEIDEDDDILGIMDTLPNMPLRQEVADDEVILETEPTETESAPEDADISADESPTNIDEPQPINVIAKETAEKAVANSANSQSNFFTFVIVALITAIVAVLFYFVSQSK